jgi:hypothetical protein
LSYASPACRTARQGFSLPKVEAEGGRLCARALLPSTRLTPTPTLTKSKPSLPLRTLDDTTPTPSPNTLLDYAFAFISLDTATSVATQKTVIDHTSIRQRVFPYSGAHSYATCALPRQQRRPPSGAKIAIHHHCPFLRRIARL